MIKFLSIILWSKKDCILFFKWSFILVKYIISKYCKFARLIIFLIIMLLIIIYAFNQSQN